MIRRSHLLAIALLGVVARGPDSPGSAAWAKGESDVYEKDVAFLLDECPKRAKALLAAKGIDWAKATKDVRAAAKKVKDDFEYVRLVDRILARLHDGHAAIVGMAPDVEARVKAGREAEAKGRRWTGPRVHLLVVGKKVFVGEAFGEAATLGVKIGMEVVTVDKVPAFEWMTKTAADSWDTLPFSTDHAALFAAGHGGLATWEGTPVSFVFLEGAERKSLTIPRDGGPNYAPSGPIFLPKGLEAVGRQSYGKTERGYGYIHVRDVAGMFKEDGRAYMIGPEPTAGMSSQKETLEVPSKRVTVRVSVASNMGRFNGGRGIEGIGVPPTEVVPYEPAELVKGIDTQIRRAEELLAKGFPKGSVEYVPPK